MHLYFDRVDLNRHRRRDDRIDRYRQGIDFHLHLARKLRQQQLSVVFPLRLFVSLQKLLDCVLGLVELAQFVLGVRHPIHCLIKVFFLRISRDVLREFLFSLDPLRVVDKISRAVEHRVRCSVVAALLSKRRCFGAHGKFLC